MTPPLVTIYVTSLTSAPKVRKNIEMLHRALRGFEIPYETYDLVNDEDAKRRWQRAKPEGKVIGLPGYLVGGEWIGTMEDFEDALETQTLETFLWQDMEVADASQTIGEAELDRLMREMTDEDLDSLVGHLSVDDAAAAGDAAAVAAEPTASETRALSSDPKAKARGDATPKTDADAAAAKPDGILAAASASLASAAAAVSETAHKGVEALKSAAEAAVEEPASVTAKRPEVEAEVAEEEKTHIKKDVEELGDDELKEPTLDDVIDKTLAREAVVEEKEEEESKIMDAIVSGDKGKADLAAKEDLKDEVKVKAKDEAKVKED